MECDIKTDDVHIASFDVGEGNSKLSFVLAIDGVDIGGGAVTDETLNENLKKVLGVEGATELDESAFSPEGLVVTLERTEDGKLKAKVTPEGAPPKFFIRVKVK